MYKQERKGMDTIGFARLSCSMTNIEIHCNALGGTIKFADLPEKIENFYRKGSQLNGIIDLNNLLEAIGST